MCNNILTVQAGLYFAEKYKRTFIVPPFDNKADNTSGWFEYTAHPDPVGANRHNVKITWHSDAFTDPYRRFTKYMKPKDGTSNVEFIDMAAFKPSAWDDADMGVISPLAQHMNCWRILRYEGYSVAELEKAYPKTYWDRDRVVCVGMQFNVKMELPKLELTDWVLEHSKVVLQELNISKVFLALHVRRGDWKYHAQNEELSWHFSKPHLRDDPIEVQCAPDDYVLKVGQAQRRILAQQHNISIDDVSVLVSTNEQSTETLDVFKDAGWTLFRATSSTEGLPNLARTVIDLAVLTLSAGFIGQYGSTFSYMVMHLRGCSGLEPPPFPCGAYYGDSTLFLE